MHDWRRDLGEAVAGCSAEVRFAEPLAQHTTFRVGGLADAWVLVRDRKALERVLSVCRTTGVRTWLLGRGSNVLVSDQGLRGVVFSLGGELAEVRRRTSEDGRPGTELVCGGGAALDAVAATAEKEGLVGVEFLAGIPGTVGGGLHSNAGAFERSLGDVVSGVVALDAEGSESIVSGTQIHREYRRPMIETGLLVLEVMMELETGNPEPAAAIRERRWAKHPTEPSAGSFFRNPEKNGERIPAGKLIEQCGLKGRAIGGAQVSEKHANFIVNTGRAKFSDVYELVQVIKATVEARTGILLEEEVQYLPGPNGGSSPDAEIRTQTSGSGVANGR
ncbi:UDP-N-acetylmuramate dehydrogenase [candidate division WOR-3 bacterium]|uniref:UDP-N-acetylenolpyruvoylglucosamine reductase n=1 Tax=candidate division WOR-3 bacterium TaxID=2052148 RepID=A0A937XEW8_UNCW3|nr:UDP-N-acetylmuramate dehydrogenase [candidate division WOR-3 bacterium]